MFMFKTRKIYYFLLSLMFIVIPGMVFATQELNITWPTSPGPGRIDFTVGMPLPQMIAYFFEWGIALGGLAVFVALLMAGAQYLTSVGEPKKMTEARERIQGAILGLAILLSSFVILDTINPHLVALEKPPPIGPKDFALPEQPKEFAEAPPCERVTIFKEQRFRGDATTFYLENCQPRGQPDRCFVYEHRPFSYPRGTFFSGSIRWERKKRDRYGNIILKNGNPIFVEVPCLCEINIYDNHCGVRVGGYLATIGSFHTDLAMVAVSIDPMDRERRIVSFNFIKDIPADLHVDLTPIHASFSQGVPGWSPIGRIRISNEGDRTLIWESSALRKRIRITPESGTIKKDEVMTVTVEAYTMNLLEGRHTFTITFAGAGETKEVPVTLEIHHIGII